ncbi:hypothetical protein [Streptomyces sp. NPDC051132]
MQTDTDQQTDPAEVSTRLRVCDQCGGEGCDDCFGGGVIYP